MEVTEPITSLDEFEEEYRKGLGIVVPESATREANLDNIRRFGDAVGDYNPLWRDENYAANSPLGQMTAQPLFFYSASLGISAATRGTINPTRLSSLAFPMNYAGDEIDFLRPIYLGDRVRSEEQVVGIERKHSERLGLFFICTANVSYYNQKDEIVATKLTRMATYKNLGENATLDYDRGQRDDAMFVAPDPLVWERSRRGADPRYWEEVVEGENLLELPKGTYTVTELFLFTHGVYGMHRSTRAALTAADSGDLGAGGRFDEGHARRRRNMPGQFDFGPQRVCWLAQIATDWAGDGGVLKRMNTRIRHPNVVGDTNVVRARVVRKYLEGSKALVDIESWNENQAGLVTASSLVTMAIPRRPAPLTTDDRKS